ELVAANERLRGYWRDQDDALLEIARRVAQNEPIAEHLRLADTTGLERRLRQEVVQRLLVFAVDSAGGMIVGPGLDSASIRVATEGSPLVVFADEVDVPIRLAVWPVWTDSGYVGMMGVGSRLDAGMIRELR